MHVAIVSDSHIPARAPAIPEPFRRRIRDADHVLHAGDLESPAALSDFRDLAAGLTAVAGNMDRGLDLPTRTSVTLEGVTFVLTHGTGAPAGYRDRVASAVREAAAADPVVGVAGHTHEVLDAVQEGVRLLNPGSVTGAPPARRTTMMTAAVEAGEVDVTVHEL